MEKHFLMENLKLEKFKAVTSYNFMVNQPKRAWFEPEKLVPAGDSDQETQIKIMSYCAAIMWQFEFASSWASLRLEFWSLGPIRRDIDL